MEEVGRLPLSWKKSKHWRINNIRLKRAFMKAGFLPSQIFIFPSQKPARAETERSGRRQGPKDDPAETKIFAPLRLCGAASA